MTFSEFTKLSEHEQEVVIAKYGNILINYLQGETAVYIYKLNDLFVKVTNPKKGTQIFEAYKDLTNLRLYHSQ